VDYDVFVIGGGINGCGIARDAAGRGFTVALCEMNDLGWATSSSSTKLIHGGLRYLEHYDFMLVRKALIEREVLWAAAPHIIEPLRLILPHHKGLRPAWLLRLGLFLYDYIGGRKKLPTTRTIDLTKDETGKPLKAQFSRAFEYSDCRVDDSRLVVLNATDAANHGANIMTRTRCKSAERQGEHWKIVTEDEQTGEEKTFTARLIVNAAGPWVDDVINSSFGRKDAHNVRLVQGSHIVVKKLFDHDRCYIFQNADERIIFAIPYHQDFTLIGTTDHDYTGDPGKVTASDEEIAYLCQTASEYFKQPVVEENIVWTYSGVRPLYDDGASKAQEATRDYVLREEGGEGEAHLFNVFGGKITTYRVLSETIVEKIEDRLGRKKTAWTASATLPGGDFPVDGFEEFLATIRSEYPFLGEKQARRMCHAYGSKIREILQSIDGQEALGEDFGSGLSEREVEYLMVHEWALTAEDVLWRRSKLGLRLSSKQQSALELWMDRRTAQQRIEPTDEGSVFANPVAKEA
jgi:glycerol-3-phosphate dehydrogenase